MRFYHGVIPSNNAKGKANSEDPDQTALIWVCTVWPNLSVPKFRIIMGNSGIIINISS